VGVGGGLVFTCGLAAPCQHRCLLVFIGISQLVTCSYRLMLMQLW